MQPHPDCNNPQTANYADALPECQDKKCAEQYFSELLVFPLTDGGTKVQWMLHPSHNDPGPYSFQLQYAPVRADDNPDNWTDVGYPVENTYLVQDPIKRMYGKFPSAHYRLKMVTGMGIYYSKPASVHSWLPHSERLLAQNLIREEIVRFKQAAGTAGYLLKRRQSGEVCSCVDRLEKLVSNPDCRICYGTGWVYGYYQPLGCTFVEFLVGDKKRGYIDEKRGTVMDDTEFVRMLNIPQVYSRDVWVAKDTDMRYSIESFQTIVEIRSLPIVLQPVEFRQFPFSDVIYKFHIQDQQRV